MGDGGKMRPEMTRAIPKQSAIWDERRNSSHVFPVPPTALPEAVAALEAFRRSQPALYAWVAEGAPNLTEAEHVSRFGEPYREPRSRKTKQPQSQLEAVS